MILLPVIDRELRLRARQGATHWTRCGVAALATMIGVLQMVLSAKASGPASAGVATFGALAWMGFLLACAASVVTADSISRERRDGTLGLLLLTELKSYDVVLGKMCAAGVTAFYALMGFVPALALVVLAGGVSGGEVARTALGLLNGLFVSLAAGMWVSARAQRRHQAIRGALLLVLGLCVAPRIVMNVVSAFTPNVGVLAALSPYNAFYMASDVNYGGAQYLFWLSLAVTHVAGWALLVWTGSYVARHWLAVELAEPRKTPMMVPLATEEAEGMAESRTAMLEEDPVCWAVSRLRVQNVLLWVGTLLLLLAGTGFSWGSLMVGSVGPAALGLWSSLYLLVNLCSAAILAWAAGRFFFETQRNGELEMLLSTPLGAREIVGGNWRALCKPLRGIWLLVVFLILMQLLLSPNAGAAGHVPGWTLDKFRRTLVPINRVLDIVAVCWVGMWFGLRSRKPVSIMGWTVGLVMGLPWMVSCLFIIGTSLGSGAVWSGNGAPLALLFWFVIWPILELAKDVFFIQWAAQKLRLELRTKASVGAGGWLK